MKTTLIIVIISLFLLNSSYAQDDYKKIDVYKYQKKETYRTWLSLNKDPIKVNGVLFEIKDSSIIVKLNLRNFIENDLYLPTSEDKSENQFDFTNIPIIDIDVIKIRREGKVGKSILIGTISGFAVGVVIGLIAGDDPPINWFGQTVETGLSAEVKAILLGVPLAVVGAGVGGLVGSAKITIPINGSIVKYNRNKNKLKRYSEKKYSR